MLLKFGKYCFLNVLNDWLTLVDVCMLETATCSHKIRVSFLKILKLLKVSQDGDEVEALLPLELIQLLNERNVDRLRISLNDQSINSESFSSEISRLVFTKRIVMLSLKGMKEAHFKSIHALPENMTLEELHLSDSSNKIKSMTLATLIKKCPGITKITLSGLLLFDNVCLRVFTQSALTLSDVSITNCPKITAIGLSDLLKAHSNITSVCLDFPRVSTATITFGNDCLEAIADNCKDLTKLHLSGEAFSRMDFSDSPMIEIIQNCPLLTDLNVSNAGNSLLSPGALQLVARTLHNLTKLSMSELAYITDYTMEILCGNCTELTYLNISTGSRINISARAIYAMASFLHKLRYIKLGRRSGNNTLPLYLVARNFESLKLVDLARCILSGVPRSSPPGSRKELPNFFPSRQILNKHLSHKYNEAKLNKVVSGLSNTVGSLTLFVLYGINKNRVFNKRYNAWLFLTFIDLSVCGEYVTDNMLVDLAAQCSMLRHVNVANCKDITDRGFTAIVRANPRLTALSCLHCVKITDASVYAMADSCPRLTTLGLAFCVLLTPPALQRVLEACVKLTEFSIPQRAFYVDETNFVSNPIDVFSGIVHTRQLTTFKIDYELVDVTTQNIAVVKSAIRKNWDDVNRRESAAGIGASDSSSHRRRNTAGECIVS